MWHHAAIHDKMIYYSLFCYGTNYDQVYDLDTKIENYRIVTGIKNTHQSHQQSIKNLSEGI